MRSERPQHEAFRAGPQAPARRSTAASGTIPGAPPLPVVEVLWLSMIAAGSGAERPSQARVCPASIMALRTPFRDLA